MNIVVFNPSTSDIVAAQAFDTYRTSEEFDRFISDPIPMGYVVVAACNDECTGQLSEKGKLWFEELGSTEIRNLEYRQGFAFIGISGKTTCHEKRAQNPEDEVNITQIFHIDRDPETKDFLLTKKDSYDSSIDFNEQLNLDDADCLFGSSDEENGENYENNTEDN